MTRMRSVTANRIEAQTEAQTDAQTDAQTETQTETRAARPVGARIRVVPANEATWDDLETVFGARGQPGRCRCQWFKYRDMQWKDVPFEARAERLRQDTNCGQPDATETTGLVAYVDGEPAGWCAVEPRMAYRRLLKMRVPWADRDEDRADDRIWAVTCFVTRTGFRRSGVSRALAAAAADFARERGAAAIEAYSMIVGSGQEVTWGELYVGKRSIFAEAGYREVSRTTRRAVMRIDFDGTAGE